MCLQNTITQHFIYDTISYKYIYDLWRCTMKHILLEDDSKVAHKLAYDLQHVDESSQTAVYRNLRGDSLNYTIEMGKLAFKLVREPDDVFTLLYNGESSLINEHSYNFLSELADDYLFESALEYEILHSNKQPDTIKFLIHCAMDEEFGKDWDCDEDDALYDYYKDLIDKYMVNE